jgi:pimeloyl-ACP methyl ester carboxylesterase
VGYGSYSRFAVVVGGFLRGLVSPRELVRIIRGSRSSLAAMFEELQGLDLRHRVRRLHVPVAFFLGRHDHHVDPKLAAEYFETLDAPAKRLLWFERSAHDIPFDEPRLLVARVVEAARTMAR